MPVGEFHEPQEVLDWIVALLEANKVALGLKLVLDSDDEIVPDFPAAVVVSGPLVREILATHKFALEFHMEIFVLHANLNLTRKQRNKADMDLATAVKTLLDNNSGLGGNIVFGYVTSSRPGVITRPQNNVIVSTRLTWQGEGRQNFI